MDFNGNVNYDIKFEYDDSNGDTDLNGACTLAHHNDIWVLGGVNDPRQVKLTHQNFR